MWRFKPFMQKEPTGLEGRAIDVGNLKIHVRNVIAEGGFSCVYSARDAVHASKQYALKHMICNDEESLELVMKEISVMKSLKGHPNIVTLYAHTILDMGRTKEALLVMEFCDKSLVSAVESRGAGYFDEKQVLQIFRDVCNAVFAMHCQSPPIAHRDLKAENLLLGSDGLWKLCDFGSTSTNHKRFEKLEEMGIEEDNIRKHTTPAYRAPEMWDMLRREFISEKVDIWALGCLLFRICYFKNAFDGESKLQILNGNYRIPDSPKFSTSVTDLIRDMLQASPDDRPDITQVWFRVNEQLPVGLQKSLPDRPPEMQSAGIHEGVSKPMNRSPPMPQRSPPPPPSSGEPTRNISQPSSTPSSGGAGGPLGAFWSTQHAKDSLFAEDKCKPKFDEEPTNYGTSRHDRNWSDSHPRNSSPVKEENIQTHATRRNVHGKSQKPEDGPPKDFKTNYFQRDTDAVIGTPKAVKTESTATFQDEAFNSFVAEFDTNKLNSGISNNKMGKEGALLDETERLKAQLKQANLEKAEITSKFEKLSAICRSQRQEIQELKQALAARSPSPNKDPSRNQNSPGNQSSATPPQREKIEGTIWDLQQGKSDWSTPSPEPKSWQAFAEDPKLQRQNVPQSVRTRNGHFNKPPAQSSSGFDTWGFGTDSFTAAPAARSQRSKPISEGNSSQGVSQSKITENQSSVQPAGWAGF
ncbi:Protein kinase superfamily protein [Melia azedarach]|uniref:Protein kinase superfamily protein n=1 Tax=Melia azedarach TaxID=155640 RepID=A0ACC1XLW1_MELAZ|nr:Protein kinase superfamily protein [Melia azedarach]